MLKGQTFPTHHIEPALYIAATPIGNLGDITLRTLETLAGADLIACEDTRVTGKLLKHFAISVRTIAYHEHNAESAGPKILDAVNSGKVVVLVSDAGTPIVSDPGFRLVESARENGISVVPLPGASAPLCALVASGLPASSWCFFGFLPTKQAARQSALKATANLASTNIFFESPNRLLKTLDDMIMVFGEDRQACVARELTKMHEEIVTTSLAELRGEFSERTIKGEIVLLVAPAQDQPKQDPTTLLRDLMKLHSVSAAASEAATLTGLPKRDLYQLALSLKDEQ